MSKNILLACLFAAIAAAGCTASMNANVTPGLPGASASPTAAASGTPTVSASAAVSVGASTAPATSAAPVAGNVDAAAAALYKLGRKWTYEGTTESAGTKTTALITREVTKVEGTKAWIKTTTTVASNTSDSTEVVDLAKQVNEIDEAIKGDDGKANYTWTQKSVGTESITVKAGTYTATKYVGTLTATADNKSVPAGTTQDATYWVNAEVGLIKNDNSGSMSVNGMTITFSSILELTAFTK